MYDAETLASYYADQKTDDGFVRKCKMTVVDGLDGLHMIDVNCRHGKGVAKLSERVGAHGFVLGVDPDPACISKAKQNISDMMHRNGFSESNVEFRVGYPENLAVAQVADASFDAAFINSSAALSCDVQAAFEEIARVLRPGGMLIFDGVVAEGEHDTAVIDDARALGNAIQASWLRTDFEQMVEKAGFDAPIYTNEFEIEPTAAATSDKLAPVAETDEKVRFIKTTAILRKR